MISICRYIALFFTLTYSAYSCESDSNRLLSKLAQQFSIPTSELINVDGTDVQSRFIVPSGYKRIPVAANSFGQYLRSLTLKPHGAKVKLYDGTTKYNNNIYAAVIDLDIGSKNLHQCADAIMRLRAEYLWSQKEYKSIHFNFTNGFKADYANWRSGKRIKVDGNNVSWTKANQANDSYKSFWKYLETVFTYAGTSSLEKELLPVKYSELSVGDVLIQGGFPGHAVIVVDVAKHISTDQPIYLLAQSYMPAQEIQILQNNFGPIGPWYSVNEGSKIVTPEDRKSVV